MSYTGRTPRRDGKHLLHGVYDNEPQVQFTRLLLERVRAESSERIDQEQIAALGVEVIAEEVANRLVVRLVKNLTVHRLLTEVTDVDAQVDLPWSAMVLLDEPERWWHRWLRVPRRRDWVEVRGEVRRWGKASVKIEHLIAFPECTVPWPEYMGRPQRYQEITLMDSPRWTEGETAVSEVPYATESPIDKIK